MHSSGCAAPHSKFEVQSTLRCRRHRPGTCPEYRHCTHIGNVMDQTDFCCLGIVGLTVQGQLRRSHACAGHFESEVLLAAASPNGHHMVVATRSRMYVLHAADGYAVGNRHSAFIWPYFTSWLNTNGENAWSRSMCSQAAAVAGPTTSRMTHEALLSLTSVSLRSTQAAGSQYQDALSIRHQCHPVSVRPL